MRKLLKRKHCDICQRPWYKVASQVGKRAQQIDHCHTCGRVREVLCIACNYYVVGALENKRYVKNLPDPRPRLNPCSESRFDFTRPVLYSSDFGEPYALEG